MTDPTFARELLEEVEALSPEDRRRVREFAHALRLTPPLPQHAVEAAEDVPEWVAQGARVEPPTVTDPAERRRLIEEVLDSMKRHPWPANAPRFTREELHERG